VITITEEQKNVLVSIIAVRALLNSTQDTSTSKWSETTLSHADVRVLKAVDDLAMRRADVSEPGSADVVIDVVVASGFGKESSPTNA
jgi:hypothetical protein